MSVNEVSLRDYQVDAVDGVLDCYHSGEPGCLVVHATGTGKTWVAAAVAAHFAAWDQKTLILADLGELLGQAGKALDHFNLRYSVEKGDERADVDLFNGEVVLGSVQSMRGKRLARWPKRGFGLVIFDEAHVALAPTYKKTLLHFDAFRVGMTATPERGDGQNLGKIFPVLAHEYPLAQAIHEKNLCRLKIVRPTTHVDLSKISTVAGDLNKGDLEDEIARHIEELVNSFKEQIGSRTALVFTPHVGSSQAFADGLRQVGVSARSVSGDSKDRDTVIAQFKQGDFQVLCNCMILTKGFDCPHISAIGMARPTKSGTLYRQMVGRGTRNCPGKENCLVVDWAWNSGRHDLVSPVELFDESGHGLDAEVQDIADGLLRGGRESDPLKAVEEAEKIHKAKVAQSVTVRARASKYKFMAFDPFEIATLLDIPRRKSQGTSVPLPEYLQNRLRGRKIEPGRMGRSQAEKLLEALDERQRAGLATHRQVACLVSNGVEQEHARTMSFAEASEQLDALIGGRRIAHA